MLYADSFKNGAYLLDKYAEVLNTSDDLYGLDIAYRHASGTINLSFADGHTESRKRSIPCYTYGRAGDSGSFYPNVREYNEFWHGKYPFP